MKALILTSSPCPDGDSHINPANGFIELLWRVLNPGARVLFVSAAPDDPGFSDYCASSMYASLESCGLSFSSYKSLDARTKNKAAKLIQHSDFIVLGGGHVPTENAFFQEIRLRELLRDYEGVIMGISAGSMNAADDVYVQPEEPGETSPDFPRSAKGLGLTRTNILPHYQKVCNNILDGKRLFEDVTYADSMGRRFYAIPDGSYLLRENSSEAIYGDCWLIENGKIRKICSAGKMVRL